MVPFQKDIGRLLISLGVALLVLSLVVVPTNPAMAVAVAAPSCSDNGCVACDVGNACLPANVCKCNPTTCPCNIGRTTCFCG